LVKYWDKYTEMHGQQNVKSNKDCLYEEISQAQKVLSSNLKGNTTTQPSRRWKDTTKMEVK